LTSIKQISAVPPSGVKSRRDPVVALQVAIDDMNLAVHLRSEIEIVGDGDNGLSAQRHQVAQDAEHLSGRDGIQAAGRLVREDDRGIRWPAPGRQPRAGAGRLTVGPASCDDDRQARTKPAIPRRAR